MAGMLFVFGKRAKDVFWRPIKYEGGSPTLVCSHSGCWTQPSVPDSVNLERAAATRGDGRPRARGPGGGCPLIADPKADLSAPRTWPKAGQVEGGYDEDEPDQKHDPGREQTRPRARARTKANLCFRFIRCAQRKGRGLESWEIGITCSCGTGRGGAVSASSHEWRGSASFLSPGRIRGPDQRRCWGSTERGGTRSVVDLGRLVLWDWDLIEDSESGA